MPTEVEPVVTHTRALKLPGIARTFEALARQARDAHWPHEDYLHEVLNASKSVAPLAFAGYTGASLVSRLVGDHAVRRFGGPAVVRVDGDDRASALGYSRVYLETRAGTHVYRVSLNRWELVKQRGEWLIAHRTTRKLGSADALDVIRPT